MTSNTLPTALFESLLPKLATILELTQKPEGTATPQAKQALLHATNDFKNTLNQAKELANVLPGGEMLVDEQDNVIEVLERIREHKRQQLVEFASRILTSPTQDASTKMEIDSTASTPYAL